MRIVDRFTRDPISRFMWGGFTLACVLGLLLSLRGEERALDAEITEAAERTDHYADTVVYQIASSPSLSSDEIDFFFRDMLIAAQGEVFTDPTVARMRLWNVEGVLRFSTDLPRSDIGTVQVADPRVIDAATQGRTTITRTTEPFTQATTGREGEPTGLLQTFVPLKVGDRIEPLGAVQIDYFYDRLVEQARDPWLQFQVVFAGLLGISVLMTVLSLRKPIPRARRAGAVAGPVPAVDVDPAREREDTRLREELDLAREQLAQAEEAFGFLETRLKKVQDEQSAASAGPSPEVQQQIASAERDREMAVARAELAEQRLAETQRRLDRLARDPSAPPPIVSDAAPEPSRRPEPTDANARSEREAAEATETAEPAGTAEPAKPTSEPKSKEPSPAGAGSPRRPEPSRDTDEPTEPSTPADAASELRARLARTAARKRLGPNVSED